MKIPFYAKFGDRDLNFNVQDFEAAALRAVNETLEALFEAAEIQLSPTRGFSTDTREPDLILDGVDEEWPADPIWGDLSLRGLIKNCIDKHFAMNSDWTNDITPPSMSIGDAQHMIDALEAVAGDCRAGIERLKSATEEHEKQARIRNKSAAGR